MDNNAYNREKVDKQKEVLLAKLRDQWPCLGHYSIQNCQNMGYLTFQRDKFGCLGTPHCPVEKSCRQMLLNYLRNSDGENNKTIDRPRKWIKDLEAKL